jgi:superfamily II RNA helicase
MVYIADSTFTDTNYNDQFAAAASFELGDFQKWAVKGIYDGSNVLVTAHTGSGKTLPAEYMIKYHTTLADAEGRERKRVIYTTPIKALSNQKLHDLRIKFPDITFGLLTGDCRDNPEADVLVMTTEILRNTLFNKRVGQTSQFTNMPLSFDMDIDRELGGVVFDEVHYINDADRGGVWEQSILLLPASVQMLMLSATIDSPEKFAKWIEEEKHKQAVKENTPPKQMILAPTYHRVVPLTHYMWLSVPQGAKKKVTKVEASQLAAVGNRQLVIKTSKGSFETDSYKKVKDARKIMWDNRVKVHRSYVLNGLVRHLKENGMLPALCFIFSRKQVELAAKSIEISLYEEGEVHSSIVEKECRKIIASKFPNVNEYLQLPEYISMIELLQKGIAVHHAGILPVIREMVELLFERGFVRLLFATETFAVGINMPTKTVIFTELQKFDGKGKRPLLPHEYTQMAGRAGRRGLDTVGHVIHCSNLFDAGTDSEYKSILCGNPQTLVSKFKISYGLALSVMASGASDFSKVQDFVDQSLVSREIAGEVKHYDAAIVEATSKLQTIENSISSHTFTPRDTIDQYLALSRDLESSKGKKQKKVRRDMDIIMQEHKHLQKDLDARKRLENATEEVQKLESHKHGASSYLAGEIEKIVSILHNDCFVKNSDRLILTRKGTVASQIQECHPLATADIVMSTGGFSDFTSSHLAAFASIFANVRCSEENETLIPSTGIAHLDRAALLYRERCQHYIQREVSVHTNTGETADVTFDLMEATLSWCDHADTEASCKKIIQKLHEEKGISLGDFVKSMLKVANVCSELGNVAQINNDTPLAWRLARVPELVMKYVVTNGSLYI